MDDTEALEEQFPEMPELSTADTAEYAPVLDPAWKDNFPAEEIEKIKERSQRLVKKHDHLVATCVVMGAARQLYNLALVALDRDLRALGCTMEDGTFACITDSMQAASMEGYRRDHVLQKLQKYCLPFMMSELQREEEEVRRADRKAEQLAAEARKGVGIPVGFKLEATGTSTLGRDRTTLLVGPPRLVAHALSLATHAALLKPERSDYDPRVVVLRLAAEAFVNRDASKKATTNLNHLRVGVQQWMHKAESVKGWTKFLQPWLRRTYRNRVDLLVVDDLSMAQSPVLVGAPPHVTAAKSQHVLRRWADQHACAILAGLPLDIPVAEMTDETWRKLEVHTDVRVVATRPCEDQSKVQVCLFNPWREKEPWQVLSIVDPAILQ
jgi:hypothetical protein